MQVIRRCIATILLIVTSPLWAQNTNGFEQKVQQVFAKHFHTYKDLEYFSGAGLSILLPNQTIKNFFIGTVSHDPNSPKIAADTLFQIGSITKSFTSAVILQLAKEKKLKLDDTLQTWLPEYDKWGKTPIKAMLNMTSGLPNYSDSPSWNFLAYKDPSHLWTSNGVN